MPSVFFSYSHADEALRDQLEKQLSLLKRQGVIEVWHDRRIGAGQDFGKEIDHHIETDDIILLLISADFLDSNYCYEKEMARAMARHEAGEAVVIPVILRACDWHGAPFGKLNATPPDGRPITQFPDRDQALLEVAKAVRAVAERLAPRGTITRDKAPGSVGAPAPKIDSAPRSSNLRVAKQFSERDRDAFKIDCFEFMAKFFENSLTELSQRNPGIEGSFRRIDANRFSAKIYKNGKSVAQCTVFLGDQFASGIAYSSSEMGNGYNELLSVDSDDQAMYLRPLGMTIARAGGDRAKLSQEGASEAYWSMLIERIQGG
ncbi:toll/interleukin-1 receptor domain-containing protein [Pseudolabrys taiwanensis]|uniref:Toll/interleukin-1 receptor domain-containing protein n=1 Tax=Pseudolabrys taiwanensis TaxID=331696 RepID=A0A345ZV16_9HYPH|nr:toll/interleukin-1 receptor domain-containing protein [Pseudolabrys taiwanensis]AXK80763.1 toll/interleukin-1 receptor domain-containing protein [Pseudolabrys taiwanensis]